MKKFVEVCRVELHFVRGFTHHPIRADSALPAIGDIIRNMLFHLKTILFIRTYSTRFIWYYFISMESNAKLERMVTTCFP